MENILEKAWFDAIAGNDLAQVEKLLEQGVDVNTKNADGQTALHLAAQQGKDELVYVLMVSKINVHIQDNNGNNALHLAALKGIKDSTGPC